MLHYPVGHIASLTSLQQSKLKKKVHLRKCVCSVFIICYDSYLQLFNETSLYRVFIEPEVFQWTNEETYSIGKFLVSEM